MRCVGSRHACHLTRCALQPAQVNSTRKTISHVFDQRVGPTFRLSSVHLTSVRPCGANTAFAQEKYLFGRPANQIIIDYHHAQKARFDAPRARLTRGLPQLGGRRRAGLLRYCMFLVLASWLCIQENVGYVLSRVAMRLPTQRDAQGGEQRSPLVGLRLSEHKGLLVRSDRRVPTRCET